MYGDGVAEDTDTERTAFRKAEKKYKLYYDQSSRKKKKPKPVDLSEVADFKSILDSFRRTGKTPDGVHIKLGDNLDSPVFGLDNHPGFYFIPEALSIEEQCQWIRECLTSFPQPPNRTNHNAFYGPIFDLFAAAQEGKVLVEEEDSPEELECLGSGHAQSWKLRDENPISLKGNGRKPILASVLLRKLRWSTLGLQFDWSKRNYDVSLPHNKIPEELCRLSKKLAVPAMPIGEVFRPEAAIVNYFGLGIKSFILYIPSLYLCAALIFIPISCKLDGPLSFSLGCKAIFLLGGKSRDDEPLAMFLRSGDAVLMAGEARECFHGVPRIFTDEEHSEIAALEKQLSVSSSDRCFLDYISSSRININIRQVF
ncbi:hypothetical protein Cgig2_018151 [Carnegiea gigantea]|uniref:Alpha-ketoglutarate-dependent dioxygenase AlkB-like domain-containing protein n=1 Tax=Carnegiea gigantea TaxID=171969 RepID=A0A9Q1KZS9_9CARY|nr:hypothetical protein Cgig2_018151 [Carnegiea gigantea]